MAKLAIRMELQVSTFECCACGVTFGMTQDFEQRRRDDHKTFYCVNGHPQNFLGKSEAERLKVELEAMRGKAAQAALDAEREREARRREQKVARGKITKLRNRIGQGACPCCNRFFPSLSRHMQSKHPDFRLPEVEPIEPIAPVDSTEKKS